MAKRADAVSVWWTLYSMEVRMMSVKSSVPEAARCSEPVHVCSDRTAVTGRRGRLQ